MNHKMNLYRKYKRETRKDSALSKNAAYLGLGFAFLLIIAALGIRYTIENHLIKGDIEVLESFVNNPTQREQYNHSKALKDEADQLSAFKDALNEVDSIFIEKDAVTSMLLVEIYHAKPKNLQITALDAEGATVSIQYKSKVETSSSKFVSNLKQRGVVKDLNYEGYTYDADNEEYTGSVVILLKGAF